MHNAASIGRILLEYHRHRSGIPTTNGPQSGAFVRTNTSLKRPDIQLHFVTAPLDNHARKLFMATAMRVTYAS